MLATSIKTRFTITAFFLLQPKLSMQPASRFSNTAITVEKLANIINRKKSAPHTRPPAIFTKILGAFGLDIWDVTAAVGDAIVKFDKWLDKTLELTKAFEKIVPYVKKAISVIKEWKSAIKDSDFYKTGANIIQGLIEGIKNE